MTAKSFKFFSYIIPSCLNSAVFDYRLSSRETYSCTHCYVTYADDADHVCHLMNSWKLLQ